MVVQTITVAFMLILLTVVTITFTRTIIRLLASTDPALAASIVSATAVVLVAILGNYVTKYQERKAQIEAEQREKKAEVYSEFLAYWYASMGRSKLPTGEKQELDQEYYEKIPQKLVVWGSEPFLKKYGHGCMLRRKRALWQGSRTSCSPLGRISAIPTRTWNREIS
jgi:hypothetical protein